MPTSKSVGAHVSEDASVVLGINFQDREQTDARSETCAPLAVGRIQFPTHC
jgi:hypothetical protein